MTRRSACAWWSPDFIRATRRIAEIASRLSTRVKRGFLPTTDNTPQTLCDATVLVWSDTHDRNRKIACAGSCYSPSRDSIFVHQTRSTARGEDVGFADGAPPPRARENRSNGNKAVCAPLREREGHTNRERGGAARALLLCVCCLFAVLLLLFLLLRRRLRRRRLRLLLRLRLLRLLRDAWWGGGC